MDIVRSPYVDVASDVMYADDAGAQLSSRWDLVEVKHDGIWAAVRLVAGSSQVEVYSRTGKLKLADSTMLYGHTPREDAWLVGEYMVGTTSAYADYGSINVFDVASVGGDDLRGEAFAVRRRVALGIVRDLPDPFRMTKVYGVDKAPALWRTAVVNGKFEGLVLRSMSDRWSDPLARVKRTFEVDYVCTHVNRSMATKFRDTGRKAARSIGGGLYNEDGELKRVVDVPGLTDGERIRLYDRPQDFKGRVFTASGKGLFPSGALRHPNFVRWRADKEASECRLDRVRLILPR